MLESDSDMAESFSCKQRLPSRSLADTESICLYVAAIKFFYLLGCSERDTNVGPQPVYYSEALRVVNKSIEP